MHKTAPQTEAHKIADSLSPLHLAMLKGESGISEQIICTRGYRTVTNLAALKSLGSAQRQCREGLLIPIWTTNGGNDLNILRPDNPRVVENNKKKNADGTRPNRVIKYEFPKGHSMRLDCPPICRQMIKDPKVALWITEGVKKADALASRGQCAIALLGVWNFKGKNEFGGTTLLADFDGIAWDNREVRIVFDSDVMVKPQVRLALDRLTEHLQRKKAHVAHVYLPNGPDGAKMGVDDYFADAHTMEELEALIQAPRPQLQPAKPIVKLLDTPPEIMRRPLTLIGGRAYVATWLWAEITVTESEIKGKIVTHNPPVVKRDLRLFVLRDDGKVFGDGGDHPCDEIGFDIILRETPPPNKLISTPGLKAYRGGERPDPELLFKNVTEIVDRFIDFDKSLADQLTMSQMVACYVMSTWFLDAFNVIGFLWPNGDRGSGKTQLLIVISELGYLGIMILAGGTYASLRDLADYGATIAFDDAENLSDPRKIDPDKRALLLAGNRRGTYIPVKEQGADRKWHTRYVNAFCPRSFSAIKLPDSVLASRTIIVPLIRTAEREKANADPMDFDLWPHSRQKLIDDLWSVALANLSDLTKYDKIVSEKAHLSGRSLEPWKALLAIAMWLDDQGVPGLWDRMNQLSLDYQKERPELETDDFTALVIRGLKRTVENQLGYDISDACDVSDTNKVTPCTFFFKTKEITETTKTVAAEMEADIKQEDITSNKIGRTLGAMRFKKGRESGSGRRGWTIDLNDLNRWLKTYNIIEADTPSLSVTNVNDVTNVMKTDVPPNLGNGVADPATEVSNSSAEPTEPCYA
jgi:hypothetical protein